MVALAKPQKQVQIVSRNERPNNFVFYVVKSSDGLKEYATTLHNSVATSCTCPARGGCYHKDQLQTREQNLHLLANGYHIQLVNGAFKLVPDGHRAYCSKGEVKIKPIVPKTVKKVSAECPVVVHDEVLTKYPTQAQRNDAPLGDNERRDFSKMVLLNK